ncbi:tryptophan halogenase family protein [Thalassotalea piscium]
MQSEIKNIVIVGGGTAGWLTAGLIAAKHTQDQPADTTLSPITITLVESPNVPTIGVGEGTWPSMRETLKKIGINEAELFSCCDASFKQASKFIDWQKSPISHNNINNAFNETKRAYYHPFSLPQGTAQFDLASVVGSLTTSDSSTQSFAQQVCYQSILCEQNLAPKQITVKAYDYIANYGYHLDAGKFSLLLKDHCIKKLKVNYVSAHIVAVNNDDMGDIASLSTQDNGEIQGDLFIDCSGAQSLLLGQHFGIPFCSQKAKLFNDTALAVQVPYEHQDSPIASCTLSTAQKSGWIWNIGLQSRCGVGYVYSSQHTSDTLAENELEQYLNSLSHTNKNSEYSIRKLSFNPGFYEKFWHRNCVAVGMSAGFIEPLEASALAMVEQAAQMISEQLPVTKRHMAITAKRFNEKFTKHWQQIIEFLKLHYVLSERDDSSYWLDNRESSSIPDSLQDMLELWKYQTPSSYDIAHHNPLFPAASYQYVLYGMNFKTHARQVYNGKHAQIQRALADVQHKRQQLSKVIESNRTLINKIKQYGLATI